MKIILKANGVKGSVWEEVVGLLVRQAEHKK